MKCKKCDRIIPESINECTFCNDGIPQVYEGIL